jgi:predicted transcriptional regulator
MEILEKLFGSPARVRIMRLFVFNPNDVFDPKEVGERTQSFPSHVRREIANMEKMGLIKAKTTFKNTGRKTKKGQEIKRKVQGYILNEKFPYLYELEALITNTIPLKNGAMVRKINKTGKIKLIIVAGIFTQDPDSRVDLLVVGDNLRRGALENAIKFIESEVGKELRYAAFETSDFHYRLSVYDKLVKDILDFPHHRVMDKIGLSQ